MVIVPVFAGNKIRFTSKTWNGQDKHTHMGAFILTLPPTEFCSLQQPVE
jgi:hypothetical protein